MAVYNIRTEFCLKRKKLTFKKNSFSPNTILKSNVKIPLLIERSLKAKEKIDVNK
jgi:hypothetical protein